MWLDPTGEKVTRIGCKNPIVGRRKAKLSAHAAAATMVALVATFTLVAAAAADTGRVEASFPRVQTETWRLTGGHNTTGLNIWNIGDHVELEQKAAINPDGFEKGVSEPANGTVLMIGDLTHYEVLSPSRGKDQDVSLVYDVYENHGGLGRGVHIGEVTVKVHVTHALHFNVTITCEARQPKEEHPFNPLLTCIPRDYHTVFGIVYVTDGGGCTSCRGYSGPLPPPIPSRASPPSPAPRGDR